MEREAAERILRRYSIEITARDGDALGAAVDLLPGGTEVFVADLPHQEPDVVIETCARLRDAGLQPVPHVVARNIPSEASLQDLLASLATRAGVDRALVLGGDREEAAGPYREALQLVESGALQTHGIRSVAFACFPEGHPRISKDALRDALRAKLDAAARADLSCLLVSQFAFEARPVLEFARELRAAGIATPLRVGVAGPARRETLRRFGHELGAGRSIHVLDDEGQGGPAPSEESPDELLSELAAAQAADPALSIDGVHFFAFGSTARTIRWAQTLRA